MDDFPRPYTRNRMDIWDSKFRTRRQEKYHMYGAQIGRQRSPQTSIVDSFLRERRFDLEPLENVCVDLRQFLQHANEDELLQSPVAGESAKLLALVDERCDRTGWKDYSSKLVHTRDWSQYAQRPPTGECQQREVVNAHGLHQKLRISNVGQLNYHYATDVH